MKEIPEDKKESFTTFENALEHAISHSKIIGGGKDGVVFHLEKGKLTEEEKDLEELFESEDEGVAAKMLKVYRPGTAAREVSMQQEAQKILKGESDKDVALVPNIRVFTEIPIHDNTKNQLSIYDINLNNKAEVLVMDYVDGKDITTLMYEHVLRDGGYDQDFIDDMLFFEKEQEVGKILNFELPSKDVSSLREAQNLKGLAYGHNEEKLFKHLKKTSFEFNPKWISTVENSIKKLHEAGVFHNDMHGRNVMVDKDGEIFLIDFGRSSFGEPTEGMSDFSLTSRWKKFFDESDPNEALIEQAEKLRERIKGNARLKGQLDTVQKIINSEEEVEDRLEKFIIQTISNEMMFKAGLANIKTALEGLSNGNKGKVIDTLQRISEESSSTLSLPQKRYLNSMLKANYF